jgi:hypothetical protein
MHKQMKHIACFDHIVLFLFLNNNNETIKSIINKYIYEIEINFSFILGTNAHLISSLVRKIKIKKKKRKIN